MGIAPKHKRVQTKDLSQGVELGCRFATAKAPTSEAASRQAISQTVIHIQKRKGLGPFLQKASRIQRVELRGRVTWKTGLRPEQFSKSQTKPQESRTKQ